MEQKNYKINLIEELAESGNKKAMLEMARHHIDNKTHDLSAVKSELILRYLTELSEDKGIAEDDSKFAMLLLGIMYYTGRGVEQNYRKAVEWYEKAADKLDSYGLCNLGYCYYYGRDIIVNYEKAYSCFSQAAFLRNPNAMYKLGDMFLSGNYINEDKNAAVYWYMEAYKIADNGGYEEKPNIEYRLGKCFLHGYGVEKNFFTALNLLQSSELGFFKLIEKNDAFAVLTLPKVRKELDAARAMM